MITSSLTGADALAQYATSLLARTGTTASAGSGTSASSTTTTASATSKPDATTALLDKSLVNFKTQTAQHKLDKQQTAIAASLRAAMTKAGVKLSGDVGFALDSKGHLTTTGSDADKAAVAAFMKSDASTPGYSSQLGGVLKSAQSLSASTQQAKAISLAARYAGGSTNVMSIYTTLMGHQDTTAAVFTLSGATASSTLTYPGMLNSQS